MLQGGTEDNVADDEDGQCSPGKSKQEKITFPEATATKPVLKPPIKSTKVNFDDLKHKNSWDIVEACSIKLTGSAPMQDFIMNLQVLLKNGQLVDKMFAFYPIDLDGTDKKIWGLRHPDYHDYYP